MKILVTGAAGYLGSVVCQQMLSVGMEVVGVDNFRYGNRQAMAGFFGHRRFTFHEADVRDERAIRPLAIRADAIIPLAALVGAPLCDRCPEEAAAVNHQAVLSLARMVAPSQKVIFPNTNSGYGRSETEVSEESPLNPISLYGRSKCEAEKAVLALKGSTVFRLATVFGVSPRMRFDLLANDWTQKLSRLKSRLSQAGLLAVERGTYVPFTIYEPDFRRNLVHVRDVAKAFLWALTSSKVEGVYNLGHPDANVTKIQLARAVCSTIGLGQDVLEVGEGSDEDQRDYSVSNGKFLATGFTFDYPLRRGIREVADYCGLLSEGDVSLMRNQ